MTCSQKVNSNENLIKEILENVIFPDIGILKVRRDGVFLDDFKFHQTYIFKSLLKVTEVRKYIQSMPVPNHGMWNNSSLPTHR